MAQTETVDASNVQEGDFLPGLDNGYVYDEPEEVDEYRVRINFHTSEGDEAHVECPRDMPVTVERKA